ncbi:MAG: CHAT domain-containing protein [Blastocatellia bacterium]|nr:CHAT domain-containing protein [Blastocatellia bacterium]
MEWTVGKTVEHSLQPGESRQFPISMAKDQYLNLLVEQKGANVTVILTGPEGKELQTVNSVAGKTGTEQLLFISEVEGTYRIDIKSLEKTTGAFALTLKALRPATPQDRGMLEARKLFAQSREFHKKGQYDQALALAQQALAVQEKTLGSDHPEVAASLQTIAELYRVKGDFSQPEALLLRALAIQEKALGPEHTVVATTLNTLAIFYSTKGELTKAEHLYQRALAMREKLLGADHPQVGGVLTNLGLLYKDKDELPKAEQCYLKALAILEKSIGPESLESVVASLNLGNLYIAMSDYPKAELALQRALRIREKALGPNHPDLAYPLVSLGLVAKLKGEFGKAEPLYRRALAILEKALGPTHPNVASILNNLASLYHAMGETAKELELHQRALEIREKALGPNNRDVAQSLHNLGAFFMGEGEYTKAEPLFERALAILEKLPSVSQLDVSQPLTYLGELYCLKGEPAKAEPVLLRALAIREASLGKIHPDVAEILYYLGHLYRSKANLEQAVAMYTRAGEVREGVWQRNLVTGSEREKLLYLNLNNIELDQTVSFHQQTAPQNIPAATTALTCILRRKGRSLEAMTDSIALLRSRATAADQKLLDELAEAKGRLSQLTLAGPGRAGAETHQTRLKESQELVEKLEEAVSLKSAEFSAQVKKPAVTVPAITKALPTGSALVEFVVYRPFDPVAGTFGKSRYAAYTLTTKGEIRTVDLGETEDTDHKVQAFRVLLRDRQTNLEKKVKVEGRALDELIMRPVRKQLGGIRRLFLSPDGALNLIPFDALVDEKNRFLVEGYELSYLTSGRDLLRLQVRVGHHSTPLVMADPDFAEGAGPELGGIQFHTLARLKGTAGEALAIKEQFQTATVQTGKEASKSNLLAVNGPEFLHLATHGFFIGTEAESAPAAPGTGEKQRILLKPSETESIALLQLVKAPLLRSGLLLAGANAGTKEENPGILTALEVAGLNLWGTELVVLSACDTGVGEVKNGEGVYGLRRALVLAGSETQMMSLWPISDEATRELMTTYYQLLKAGIDRNRALRAVQLGFLYGSKVDFSNVPASLARLEAGSPAKSAGKHSHPYFWAAFIQSGEWKKLTVEQ